MVPLERLSDGNSLRAILHTGSVQKVVLSLSIFNGVVSAGVCDTRSDHRYS